jgi:hypothetical protein
MPTVAYVPRSALAIRRDSSVASAGWAEDVQMPGAVRAGAGKAGMAAGPGTSSAVSGHACTGHRLHRRIGITLLGAALTIISEAGVTMSSGCEQREYCAGSGGLAASAAAGGR